jgi:peroxiredoxin family protein
MTFKKIKCSVVSQNLIAMFTSIHVFHNKWFLRCFQKEKRKHEQKTKKPHERENRKKNKKQKKGEMKTSREKNKKLNINIKNET